MNHRNLIPAPRLAAKRRQRAVRRWVVLNGGYFAVLTVVGAFYAWSAFGETRYGATAVVATDVQKSNATLAGLREESTALKTRYQSIHAVSGRPDWSILLSVVSQVLGDDVALNAVDLAATAATPVTGATTGAAAGGDVKSRRFVISGVGRSQQAVTEFVLRVEALGFFDRVRMVQNGPQSLRGAACVGFTLVCPLPDPIGGR